MVVFLFSLFFRKGVGRGRPSWVRGWGQQQRLQSYQDGGRLFCRLCGHRGGGDVYLRLRGL